MNVVKYIDKLPENIICVIAMMVFVGSIVGFFLIAIFLLTLIGFGNLVSDGYLIFIIFLDRR